MTSPENADLRKQVALYMHPWGNLKRQHGQTVYEPAPWSEVLEAADRLIQGLKKEGYVIHAQSTREPEISVSVLEKLSSTEEMDIDFLLNSLVDPKVDPTFNRGIVAGFRRQLIQVAAAEAALLALTSPECSPNDARFINCEVCQTEGRILTNDGGPDDVDHGVCPECKGERVVEVETQPITMEDFHPDKSLPGCMMPDGGDCCAGHAAVVEDWHKQRREIERLRAIQPQEVSECPEYLDDATDWVPLRAEPQRMREVLIRQWIAEARQLEEAAEQEDIGDEEAALNKYCAEQIRKCIRELDAFTRPECGGK